MSLDTLVDDVMYIIIPFIGSAKSILNLKQSSKRYNTIINIIVDTIKRKYKYRADRYLSENNIRSNIRYVPEENIALRTIIENMQSRCFAHTHIELFENTVPVISRMVGYSCCMCGRLNTCIFSFGNRYFKVTLYGIDNIEKTIDMITVEYIEICSTCDKYSKPPLFDNNVCHFSYIITDRRWKDNPMVLYTVKRVNMLCNN
jgi:hypothetical protein